MERITKLRQGYEIKLNSWNHQENGVILDIFVTHTRDESLPGITAELYHFDSHEVLLQKINLYLDTDRIPYGISSQLSLPVEGLTIKEEEGLGLKYFHYPTDEQIFSYREYQEHLP